MPRTALCRMIPHDLNIRPLVHLPHVHVDEIQAKQLRTIVARAPRSCASRSGHIYQSVDTTTGCIFFRTACQSSSREASTYDQRIWAELSPAIRIESSLFACLIHNKRPVVPQDVRFSFPVHLLPSMCRSARWCLSDMAPDVWTMVVVRPGPL